MKCLIVLFTLFISCRGFATDNMQFHGALIAPPCSISNGQMIEVDFGNDLGVNKIDGNNYKQPVKYTVECEPGYAANNLAIVIDTVSPSVFDASALKTNKDGLGIRILVDGAAVTFSSRIVIVDPTSPPVIEAVPVQDQSISLTEGAFEATMTLRADYM